MPCQHRYTCCRPFGTFSSNQVVSPDAETKRGLVDQPVVGRPAGSRRQMGFCFMGLCLFNRRDCGGPVEALPSRWCILVYHTTHVRTVSAMAGDRGLAYPCLGTVKRIFFPSCLCRLYHIRKLCLINQALCRKLNSHSQ